MTSRQKNYIMDHLRGYVDYYVTLPPSSAPRSRGVLYFVPIVGIDCFYGAMNSVKEGQHLKKRLIVRKRPEYPGLLQTYIYHFPKTWSHACVANRELIKEAQRQAHALEHESSFQAVEWRIRFLMHYYNVFKGGAKPAPGMKPYSRFYQFVYVSIYRELQQAHQQALQTLQPTLQLAQHQAQATQQYAQHQAQTSQQHTQYHPSDKYQPDDIDFEQIDLNPLQTFRQRRASVHRLSPEALAYRIMSETLSRSRNTHSPFLTTFPPPSGAFTPPPGTFTPPPDTFTPLSNTYAHIGYTSPQPLLDTI